MLPRQHLTLFLFAIAAQHEEKRSVKSGLHPLKRASRRRWKKRWLTLVERGGAVDVSRDEGGLRLLPHRVVPHPPYAALGGGEGGH